MKQYTYPKRASIGRVDPEDPTRMTPNENFLKYFPDAESPEEIDRSERSPYLNIGTYVVLHKLIQDCKLKEILDEYMDEKDTGFLLDLACYSIIEENNAGQYYPDYAYEHALFTPDMKIYTDSKVSDFLHGLKPEQSVGFLNSWNKSKNKRQKIYLSYDSTNKNCQAGDIDLVECGNAKVDAGLPIFNYSVACDSANRTPLFYELYPGSLNDVSQLICMIDKAQGYGYRNIGFILDRGYFSKKNLAYMDQNGYSFLIMVKGMKDFIRGIIEENQGGFENSRGKYVDRYDVYGTTVKRFLCEGDTKKRNFHIYYSDGKAYSEKQEIKQRIRRLKKYLDSCVGKECEPFGPEIGKYFHLNYEKDGKGISDYQNELDRAEEAENKEPEETDYDELDFSEPDDEETFRAQNEEFDRQMELKYRPFVSWHLSSCCKNISESLDILEKNILEKPYYGMMIKYFKNLEKEPLDDIGATMAYESEKSRLDKKLEKQREKDLFSEQ